MKLSIPALAVSFVVGVVAGAGTALNPVHPLQAAGSPPAYVVYEANVTDPDGYKNDFLKAINPALEKHAGKFLARGGMTKQYLGSPPENRVVIAQYEDIAAANAFFEDTKSDFETLAPKYANGIRYYAVEGLKE
jgi:uncharacterized protein (DUF1330 family)